MVLEFLCKISIPFFHDLVELGDVKREKTQKGAERVVLGQGRDGMPGPQDAGGGDRNNNHAENNHHSWHYWRSYCGTGNM